MPVFELEESNYAGPIPEDTWLQAELVNTEDIEGTNSQTGEKYQKVRFSFVVVDADSEYAEQRVRGNTPTTFTDHPDCKLRNWAQELLGVDELPPKFKLVTEDLHDRPCNILVGQYEYERDGETRIANYVKDVKRWGHGAPRGAGEAF